MIVPSSAQAFQDNPLEEKGYQIVHAIAGRIRLRISWLETDADSVGKFQRLLESLNCVTGVRINPSAQSVVITYRASAISSQEAVERFVDAMQQVKPTSVATTTQSSPSQPSPEEVVQMAQTVAQTITQTVAQAITQTVAQVAQVAQSMQSAVQTDSPAAPAPEREQSATPPPHSSEKVSESTPISAESEFPSPWDTSDDPAPPTPLQKSTPIAPAVPPIPPDEPTQSPNPPVQPELWLHSTASLAKRLNVTSQAITRHRGQPDFATWTQKQDPEGVAWSYDAPSQSFYPFTPLASPLEPPPTEPALAHRVEAAGAELVGETTGEEVGIVIGVGELALGSIGAVIGEEIGWVVGEVIGAEVGKQAVETEPAKSAAQKESPQTRDPSGAMSEAQEAPEPVSELVSEPVEGKPKSAFKTAGKKPKGKRSPAS